MERLAEGETRVPVPRLVSELLRVGNGGAGRSLRPRDESLANQFAHEERGELGSGRWSSGQLAGVVPLVEDDALGKHPLWTPENSDGAPRCHQLASVVYQCSYVLTPSSHFNAFIADLHA